MALIKCSECGKEISDKASSCPNCGCPVQVAVSNEPLKTFKGINGTIVVFQDRVEIRREGFLGIGRGDSVFSLEQISSIYVYNGNILMAGYIQILTAGQANSKDLNSASGEDNAVTFRTGARDEVAELKNIIYKIK